MRIQKKKKNNNNGNYDDYIWKLTIKHWTDPLKLKLNWSDLRDSGKLRRIQLDLIRYDSFISFCLSILLFPSVLPCGDNMPILRIYNKMESEIQFNCNLICGRISQKSFWLFAVLALRTHHKCNGTANKIVEFTYLV